MFYAELEIFVLKCKFNSKSLPPSLKISGCATGCNVCVSVKQSKDEVGIGSLQFDNDVNPCKNCIYDSLLVMLTVSARPRNLQSSIESYSCYKLGLGSSK